MRFCRLSVVGFGFLEFIYGVSKADHLLVYYELTINMSSHWYREHGMGMASDCWLDVTG